jgi:fructose-1,6-bisphosphatase/sedoheptulose 1,7-bisphosphatase-like protein
MPVPVAQPSFGLDGEVVRYAIAATRAAATAMRAVLGSAPGSGTVVTGEGAKDRAPMLADGERRALEASGAGLDAVLSLDDLASEDAVFVATGVTGGLLAAPRHHDGRVTTETLVIATGTVHRMQTTTQE